MAATSVHYYSIDVLSHPASIEQQLRQAVGLAACVASVKKRRNSLAYVRVCYGILWDAREREWRRMKLVAVRPPALPSRTCLNNHCVLGPPAHLSSVGMVGELPYAVVWGCVLAVYVLLAVGSTPATHDAMSAGLCLIMPFVACALSPVILALPRLGSGALPSNHIGFPVRCTMRTLAMLTCLERLKLLYVPWMNRLLHTVPLSWKALPIALLPDRWRCGQLKSRCYSFTVCRLEVGRTDMPWRTHDGMIIDEE